MSMPLAGKSILGANSSGAITPNPSIVGPGVEFTFIGFGATDFFDVDFFDTGVNTLARVGAAFVEPTGARRWRMTTMGSSLVV